MDLKQKMLDGARGCSRLCECGVSTCINPDHQDWLCVCGHSRPKHQFNTFWLVDPKYAHPHGCKVAGCDCEELDFSSALTTIAEAIADLRRIQSDTQ